ncbi:trace amine-associated receptor 8b-like [Oculina patagonica]
MATSNSTQALADLCVKAISIEGKTSLFYDVVTFTTCVMNAVLSPVAVAGNSLILAAIWRNPSLRTPSYILLAGLAFTDFGTGLVTQPFYALERFAEFKRIKTQYCFAYRIANIAGPYLSVATALTITFMAVERWLHVTCRSLITVRRVFIIYCLLLLFPIPYILLRWKVLQNPSVLPWSNLVTGFSGLTCLVVMLVAYSKVFAIIRRHRMQITHDQGNNGGINLAKYKKSVFTILYILACFEVTYAPHVFCVVVVGMLKDYTEVSAAFLHLTSTIVYWSSSLNPIVYCWRMKRIRDGVKRIVK